MNIEYVIIQAGGIGTRMGKYTANRPKALVPINNRPLLWHIFESFPGKNFIIIGDYKYGVLQSYLSVYCWERYILLQANAKGNAAGIADALQYIPDEKPFAVVWCDLLLSSDVCGLISELDNGVYAATTEHLETSRHIDGHGVLGLYLFDGKYRLSALPSEGSFFEWLSNNISDLKTLPLDGAKEFGTAESLEETRVDGIRSRPYNRIDMDHSTMTVTKTALTAEAEKLLERECAWYRKASECELADIPKIISYKPLKMECIDGTNVFRASIDQRDKIIVLKNIIEALKRLHRCDNEKTVPYAFDMWEDYYAKTLKRLYSIAQVIPFADKPTIMINGKQRRNLLFHLNEFADICRKLLADSKEFVLIHGDNTLTNTLINNEKEIKFIDARGYFGKTELYGDPDYDWAKLYYSIAGNFDNFNIGAFSLEINDSGVAFKIDSCGWEFLTEELFDLTDSNTPERKKRIKTIHAIIWLSLASHCWEDYDSLCCAFYNGLELLWTAENDEHI